MFSTAVVIIIVLIVGYIRRAFTSPGQFIIGLILLVGLTWFVRACNFSGIQLGSCAVIEYENQPTYEILNPYLLKLENERAYFFNVRVSAKSCHESLRVHSWTLNDVRRLEDSEFKPWGEIDSLQLVWEISPLIPKNDSSTPVSFAHIYASAVQAQLERHLGRWNSGFPEFRFHSSREYWHPKMKSHLEPGIYRFRLRVSFYNAAPAEALFELNWSGKHHDNIDLLAREIQIKKLVRPWWNPFGK